MVFVKFDFALHWKYCSKVRPKTELINVNAFEQVLSFAGERGEIGVMGCKSFRGPKREGGFTTIGNNDCLAKTVWLPALSANIEGTTSVSDGKATSSTSTAVWASAN